MTTKSEEARRCVDKLAEIICQCEIDNLRKALKAAEDELAMRSEWIPIDKQMPPAGKSVLLLQKTGYKDNCVIIVGHYVEKFTEECSEEWSEYCEEKDEYFLPEGFYEHQFNWGEYAAIGCNEPVTHWMPQPEKPMPEPPHAK